MASKFACERGLSVAELVISRVCHMSCLVEELREALVLSHDVVEICVCLSCEQ